MNGVGGYLKSKREELGLSLEEIAVRTRIATHYLSAIENDCFHQLPGKPYQRFFLREYASQLNLDFEEIWQKFKESEITEEVLLRSELAQSSALWKRWVGAFFMAAGLFLALFLFIRYGHIRSTGPASMSSGKFQGQAESKPESKLRPEQVLTDTSGPLVRSPLILRLEGLEDTGIRVIADKDTVFDGLIRKNEQLLWYAQASFTITLGKAWSVIAYVNDQKLRRFGKRGQSLFNYSISANNYRNLLDTVKWPTGQKISP